jgi:hypothetical protein
MKELLTTAAQYAGELIVGGLALLVRSIEMKIMLKRKRKEWEAGETYSKIEGKPDKK